MLNESLHFAHDALHMRIVMVFVTLQVKEDVFAVAVEGIALVDISHGVHRAFIIVFVVCGVIFFVARDSSRQK